MGTSSKSRRMTFRLSRLWLNMLLNVTGGVGMILCSPLVLAHGRSPVNARAVRPFCTTMVFTNEVMCEKKSGAS